MRNKINNITVPLFVFSVSFIALAGAYISEYGFDMIPCDLCLYQRKPYFFVMAIALVALLLRNKKDLTKPLLILCFLAFLAGAIIAGHHVGVEQGWWESAASCGSGGVSQDMTFEEFREQIMNAPMVRCDEPQFELFGITMAGYNFLYSVDLALVCLLGFFILQRNKEKEAVND